LRGVLVLIVGRAVALTVGLGRSQAAVRKYKQDMKIRRTFALALIVASTISSVPYSLNASEQGFAPKYARDYNPFDPVNRYRPNNPLNPADRFRMDNPFSPINRFDPGNPANPVNRFNPNNPFNPINRFNPANPLNPINRYNPNVPFAPLDW
jgi:hypothetical protein